MAKKIKVLVLGATGIIGKELVKASLGRGYEVYAVSRGSKPVQEGAIGLVADARDSLSLATAIGALEFDTVIDLVSFSGDQAAAIIDVIRNKSKQYIFTSSATVYGESSVDSPIVETSDRVTVGWGYPLKKIEAERVVTAMCAKYELEYTIVRPYITYSEQRIAFGEWEGESILGAIASSRPIVLGNELAESLTTLTHSYDLAAGVAGLIANPKAYSEDFHITSDQSMTWREVFELTGEIIGVKPRIVDVGIEQVTEDFPELKGKIQDRCLGRVFDNTKIKSAVDGFGCSYSVEQGYREIISKMLERGDRLSAFKSGNVLQGRVDRLALKHADSMIQKDIRQFRRKLNFKARILYSIGFYSVLYKSAMLTRRVIKGDAGDDYAVG